MFVPNFKILLAVVPDKYFDKIVYRHRQTNIVAEKTKIITPFTSYTCSKMMDSNSQYPFGHRF